MPRGPLGRRAAAVLSLAALLVTAPAVATTSAGRMAPLSADARAVVGHVQRTGDARGAPFVVIDKRQARLWLFHPDGRAAGSTPVLLGLARGDHTVPGIGDRPFDQIAPDERTTPAGRFVAEHGRNHKGDDILWVDYEAAVSMHRVRSTHAGERRLQRLASRTPRDNRISYGCINVPTAFYDQALRPLALRQPPVVYVLPETRPAMSLFESTTARGG